MKRRSIYQHPLAYLLGLEGLALLRAFAGDYGREFTLTRLDEMRALLDSAEEFGDGVEASPISTRDGYAKWAPFYDAPGNEMVDLEQPVVREILEGLPVGVALDAACGTGRHTSYLASLRHQVIGVDASPEMLAIARAKVPDAEFHEADLHSLPVADESIDVVVCALALVHVPDLEAALAEFVRVLRPGGHLVVSDPRGIIGTIGPPAIKRMPDATLGYMRSWFRPTSEYLGAALRLGLQVRRSRSCSGRTRSFPKTAQRIHTTTHRRRSTFRGSRLTSGR
jgi:SAM-dependent methyltransferase